MNRLSVLKLFELSNGDFIFDKTSWFGGGAAAGPIIRDKTFPIVRAGKMVLTKPLQLL